MRTLLFRKTFKKIVMATLAITIFSTPFTAALPAHAVDNTVILLSTSTFVQGKVDQTGKEILGTATLNFGAAPGSVCSIAVGPTQASPDYKWFQDVPCTTVTVNTLPVSASMLHIRVFNNGSWEGQDFTLYPTTNIISPVSTDPIVNPTYRAPRLVSPLNWSVLTGNSQQITWTNEGAKSYEVRVGTKYNATKYGVYKVTGTSVLVSNLPVDGSKVYIRIISRFINRSYGRLFTFTAYKTPVEPLPSPAPAPAPIPEPAPAPVPAPAGSGSLSAIWVSEGGSKVPQEDLWARDQKAGVINSAWNGSKVSIFGGKNEVVNFDLVLEAANKSVGPVSISFDKLTGPNGYTIASKSANGEGLYNWVGRNIELFYVRYLQIKGLSTFASLNYDERHRPEKFQTVEGLTQGAWAGTWTKRPDHDKSYPDIAVPLELHSDFTIEQGKSQSVWADVYIPKDAPAGLYNGVVTIKENGVITYQLPVELNVYNFALPDTPTSKTMLYMGAADLNKRYVGEAWPSDPAKNETMKQVRDRLFQMAHRHKISLIDADPNAGGDAPSSEWASRLNGSLFTTAKGYDGPGVGVGNNVYSIGTYGSWNWKGEGQAGMWKHADNWANWFAANAPGSEYFLYLIDESSDYAQIEQWSQWINNNPGVGKNMKSLATISVPAAAANTPSLDIPVSTMYVGDTATWQNAANKYLNNSDKRFYMYNGGRPGQGSFMTEDDGVALRELAWGQYKKGINRWFYWESTYYNNYQGGTGETNVFRQAHTFGSNSSVSTMLGQNGWNYSNGDGVLFYPGTDKVYTSDSYNVPGPMASLRLKYWRRGIQDADYLALASKINPTRVQEILNSVVPKVLWEYGVDSQTDPTYKNTAISWSSNPDIWEAARKELAQIIAGN